MIGLCLLACVGAASAAAVKGSARSGGAWTSTAAGGLRLTKPAPIAGAGLSSRSIAPARVAGPYTATTRGAAGGSSSNWAVIFDYVSPTNYRYASVAARRGGGNGIFSVRGRSVRRLAAFRAVSARGSAHTLRVERRGSGVVVLRDGSVLATASGLGAPVGRVGVGTRGAAATFTRLQLARLDTTAPTSMIYEGPATDESTFDDGVSFVFEATERARFECSLDGGAFKSCASGVSYDGLAPGVHDFELRAIDAAGNVQQPTTHRIWHVLATGIVGGGSGDDDAPDPGPLDVRAPVLSISSGPAAGLSTAATSAAFMLTADEAARFECRIDTGAWEACTTNMTYAALAVGAHAFQARATDTAGNVSAVVQRAWTVVAGSSPPPTDTTAPTVAITSGPTAGSSTTATTAAFTFTSTEPGQFACRLDAGAWATCSSGISFGTLSVGSHTFAVKASDAQGNQSTSATRTWTIVTPPDTTAPTVTITGGPANGASTAATSASFTFSANEASAFTCTLDAAASTTCTSGVTYGSLAVGSHTWSITARDGAGNTSTATTRTWTVVTPPDTTAPTVTITGGPANGSTSTATSAAFTFAANETSAFTCKLDAAAFVTCSSGVSYASLGVGAHTFAVRATDAAGNVSVTVTRTWTVAAAAGGTPATVTTPAGLKVEYGGTPGTVKFTWTAAPDLSSSHTNYQVLRDGSGRAKLGLSTLTWVDSGLDTGVSHYYGVRPISASGSVLGTIREVRYVVPAVPADTGFVHPGIGESRAQLDFVKGRIAAGAEPWTGALAKAKSSRFGKATWAPTPQVDLRCGTAGQPNIGCSNHTDDAVAAYTHALIWYYTGATASRDKALEILNAYSATEQRIYFDSMVNTNGKLTAAWAAETFTRAAEIMRYSGSGWTASDIARFERLLIDVYHPIVWDGWPAHNGNWLSTMANAELAIGVFTNNRSLYDEGINDWRNTTPAQVYMSADGPKPLIPLEGSMTTTTYNNAKFFQQGMYSETCRDLGHTAMGLDSITNAAETAWIQGIDLYGEQQARIIAGYEHLSHYAVHPDDPAWPCPNPVAQGGASNSLVGDVAYNHYAVRRGIPMPELKVRLQSSRPTSAGLHMAWETLTHAAGPL